MELQELSKNPGEFIEFQTTIFSKTPEGKTHYHFRAVIQIVLNMPEVPTYERLDLREDNIISTTGQGFYQQDHLSLFHGPSFQKITRVINITPEKITTECCWEKISDQQQGQFPVKWHNPYAIDLSTQAIWVWLTTVHREICLPGQLTNCTQFSDVPANSPFYVSCEIKGKTTSGVTADFIIHSREGKIYSQLLGAKAVIFPKELFKCA